MTTGTILAGIWLAIAAPSLFVFAWLCKRAPEGFEDERGFHFTKPDHAGLQTPSREGSRACPKDIGPAADISILSHEHTDSREG